MADYEKNTGNAIEKISNEFAIAGEYVGGVEIDSGLINTTYVATYERESGEQRSYILQRINEQVFKDPLAVMANVESVTRHINWKVLRDKKDMGGQTLNIYPARGGKSYAVGEDGGAAKAFGSFQDLVSDMPVEEIAETIPDFHHTPKRFDRLMEVVNADVKGRLKEVEAEVAFIAQREELCRLLVDMADAGEIPMRVTHNDTKLNNVMMDEQTDEAVCVIDLDTVMPGLSLYDFGDLVRTATSPAEEDETDLTKVEMRMSMFEALAQGYIDGCDCLTDVETEHLVTGGKLMTLEVAIRFLTDYLEGDIYFKTDANRPEHNLERCRTQLKLIESIEAQEEEMRRFVKSIKR